MLWLPTVRLLLLQVAVLGLPTTSALVAQPAIDVPPSVKLTLPLGLAPLTVAVKVTVVPNVTGLPEVASAVVVGAGPAGGVTAKLRSTLGAGL